MPISKKCVVAVLLAFPVAAFAQSNQELKAEIDALKAKLQQLEKLIEQKTQAAPTPAPAPAAEGVDPAEFNRIRVKVEAMEDAQEAQGFKGLKISGYMDPTYIYNRNQKSSSFVFLNNFTDLNGSGEAYTYDNSYFGGLLLRFEKEMEGGTKWKFELMPHKSAGSGINFGSIVHEASVSIPLADLQTRVLAGQIPDWTGYEYWFANQTKLITHNLLFDFTAGTTYTGAGMEVIRGKWDVKGLVGNLNNARISDTRNKTPGVFYRVDYSKGEFQGFGFAGVHAPLAPAGAFSGTATKQRVDSFELDGYFIRGDVTAQAQATVGRLRQGAAALNDDRTPKDSRWWGLSTLAAYKFAPRFEGVARLDYVNNSKNGGNLFGSLPGSCDVPERDDASGTATGTPFGLTGGRAAVNCPDGLNGFGPGMVLREDSGEWEVEDPNKGANRWALSLGLNFAYSQNVMLKSEYRYDRASLKTFSEPDSNFAGGLRYRRDNHVFGVSTVISF